MQALTTEGGTVMEVLPALQKDFVKSLDPSESGPIQEAIGKFVAARELSGHPTAVQRWEEE